MFLRMLLCVVICACVLYLVSCYVCVARRLLLVVCCSLFDV